MKRDEEYEMEFIRNYIRTHDRARITPIGLALGYKKGVYVGCIINKMPDVYEEDDGTLRLNEGGK